MLSMNPNPPGSLFVPNSNTTGDKAGGDESDDEEEKEEEEEAEEEDDDDLMDEDSKTRGWLFMRSLSVAATNPSNPPPPDPVELKGEM